MLETLTSMTVPVLFLLTAGSITLLLGWWMSVEAEGKDEWLLGDDDGN